MELLGNKRRIDGALIDLSASVIPTHLKALFLKKTYEWPERRLVVRHFASDVPVIELGGSLGLEVVAEGVEDEQTWQALKRMGCSAAQGYFIGRPMPVGELQGWMRNWSDRSATSRAA